MEVIMIPTLVGIFLFYEKVFLDVTFLLWLYLLTVFHEEGIMSGEQSIPVHVWVVKIVGAMCVVQVVNEVVNLGFQAMIPAATIKDFPRCPGARSAGLIMFHANVLVQKNPDSGEIRYLFSPGDWQDSSVTVH